MKTWPKFRIIIIIAVLILLVFLLKLLGIFNFINIWLQQTINWLDSLGFWAPFVFILLYILATVFLISGAILTLGAGALFGIFQGSIYVSLGSTLGATVAFLAGRYLAREKVAAKIEKNPKFKAVDRAVGKEGWKIVALTRLSPLFPFVFLNYAFGVTKVSFRDYVLASWLGMIPGTIMYVYLGYLAKDLTSLGAGNQGNTWIQWLGQIIGFVATLIVTIYVTKIAQKALDEKMESE